MTGTVPPRALMVVSNPPDSPVRYAVCVIPSFHVENLKLRSSARILTASHCGAPSKQYMCVPMYAHGHTHVWKHRDSQTSSHVRTHVKTFVHADTPEHTWAVGLASLSGGSQGLLERALKVLLVFG